MNNWHVWFMLGMFVGTCLGVLSMIVCDIYFMDKIIQAWLKPRLSKDDIQDLRELAKGLERFPNDPEEVEAVRKAILEIVEAKSVTARKLEDTL